MLEEYFEVNHNVFQKHCKVVIVFGDTQTLWFVKVFKQCNDK
jgi:hypothetical protein